MNAQGESFPARLGDEVRKASGWYIAFGVLLLLGGIAAVARPLHAGLTVAFVVGWVLIINGIMAGAHALLARGAGGFVWRVLMSLLYIIGGIVSIVLAILIWMKLPEASELMVGMLIGLDFIMSGVAILVFGTGARKLSGALA